MASIATNVPVMPTALGTVIEKKNVPRLLLATSRGHQIGPHVLDDVNAVVGEQHLMDRKRFVLALAGDHLDGPSCRRRQPRSSGRSAISRQPCRAPASPLLYSVFLAGCCRKRSPPAGMKDHDIAFAQRRVRQLQAGLQIFRGDDRSLSMHGVRQLALVFSLFAC